MRAHADLSIPLRGMGEEELNFFGLFWAALHTASAHDNPRSAPHVLAAMVWVGGMFFAYMVLTAVLVGPPIVFDRNTISNQVWSV
jgi:hypothetical protein